MDRRLLPIAILATVSAFGCASEDDKQVLEPVVMGMTETTPPTYDDGQQRIYEVHHPVELPLRRPADNEMPQGQAAPFPRPPFHLAKDTRITVRFTLTNLEDRKNTVELLLDPWNEFVRYVPGVVVNDEATTPNLSGWDKFFVLEPKQRIEGIVTPDDMVELATDLATAMTIQSRPPAADSQFGGPALYNRAFNLQNRSSQPDPVLAPFLPATVPNVVGFDLGIRIYERAAKVAVELVIDVEDKNGSRVIKDEDKGKVKPYGMPDGTLTPPAAARR